MPKKKIYKLLIGSNNKGKLKEIRDLLPYWIKTFTPSQLKIKSPKENIHISIYAADKKTFDHSRSKA